MTLLYKNRNKYRKGKGRESVRDRKTGKDKHREKKQSK